MRERLIGAIVLVVIAIVLIPWLVSRAHHPSEQVHMLPLPAAATAAAASVLPLPPANKPLPDATAAPASRTAAPTINPPATATVHTQVSTPAPMAAKPAVSKGASRNKPTANVGGWYVQVASFSSHDGAQTLAAKLSKAGFHAYVSSHAVKGRTWYRVRVGPYKDGATARAASARIAGVSHTRVFVRESDGHDG